MRGWPPWPPCGPRWERALRTPWPRRTQEPWLHRRTQRRCRCGMADSRRTPRTTPYGSSRGTCATASYRQTGPSGTPSGGAGGRRPDDKEHLITGMLPQEGGFAIMLQETGIATRAQEMQVAAALRNKGYTPYFSSRLAETGATSTSRGGGLLTAVSSKYVAEQEVLSFTEILLGKAAALEIRTDGGGLTLINVHRPQAGCSQWAGRAAFWADIQMYAMARSLGGRHPVVIAGDTNVYMDATSNPATEHFRAGREACGFRRATAGGEEDMTPTLHPSRHRVDTFVVNEPLLPWTLRESVWARGMAHPQVIGSDHLPVRLALPGLLIAAGRAAMPTPYSHTEGLWAAVTAAEDEPSLAPWLGPAEQHAHGSMPPAAVDKVFEHLHAAHDALARVAGRRQPSPAGTDPAEGDPPESGKQLQASVLRYDALAACAPAAYGADAARHGIRSEAALRLAEELQVRCPGSARPHRASYRRSWRGKRPPSKRTFANSAHSWLQTASAPSRTSGAATPLASPSDGKPCGEP